ncbi:hypothetical protein ACLKMH_10890 [Psychromonas sp. KJ10-10]|uniref:hypothetical protein n=1 Tax=Psychromonas sp. KJ10-10 TaxID=3391823 RepID=UPI0039B37DD1
MVNSKVSSEKLPSVWKPHLVVVIGLFIVATLVPAFTSDLAKSEPFKAMLATQEAINNNELVKYATVTEGSTTFTSTDSGSKTNTYVNIQAYIYKNNVEDFDTAKQLAQTIIKTYPESLNKNLIQVTLKYGYDIGIVSKWNSYNYQFNPKELNGSE